MSNLEKIVYKILKSSGYQFLQEKQFKDLRNGLYRFDFYIPSSQIAIEVQGAQHYQFISAFFSKKSEFTKAQERDRDKISYCLAHGIALYCIPYWEIESLQTYNDLVQEKFRARSKFHNDMVWRTQKSKGNS